MNNRSEKDLLGSVDQRVKLIADLIVAALLRTRTKDLPRSGFSAEVGVDNTSETRVYGHHSESPGGRM